MPVIDIKLPDFGVLIEEVTTEIKERIKDRTPVRTGRAQTGWESTPGRVWNDVPYIGYLEEGTSKMSPFHMVRTTLEELPEIVENALKKAE